jgi:AI-2 transport protein TqsA
VAAEERTTDSLDAARTPLVMLATFVLVLIAALALHEVAGLVVPILFGLLLALVATPLVGVIERRGHSHRLAMTTTIVVVLGVMLAAVAIMVYSIAQFVAQLPQYQDQLADDIERARQLLADAGLAINPEAATSIISPSAIVSLIRPIAATLGQALIAIFVMVLTLIYAIVGSASMRRRANAAFGSRHALLAGVEQFGVDLRRYLIVRAELGLFAAVLALVLLVILGIPFPLLWAFLTFAASFIPNVGFIIALIPPTILGFLEGGWVTALIVVVGYTAINMAQDNLLQPLIMGSELNLSPLVIFVAVIAWTWILGASGALLAVPLTVALVTLMEASPWSSGAAQLMRNRTPTAESEVAG